MADNDTTISPATAPGNIPVASDDISGVFHQRVKLEFGENGTATDVSDTDPLPVDGTVSVSNFPAAQPVTDNGGSLTVDGTVAVSNFPAAQPVTDNGGSLTVDGTVGVSGTVTVDTELAAAAALVDAAANPTVPTVGAAPLTYNGTTWDRARAATSAAGTTGTGLAGTGALGFDGTNYQRVKTDSAGVVQTAFAATPAVDTELPTAAALADATANPTIPTVGASLLVYNGTTWDRARAANSAAGTTGTGLAGAGALGFDGTNYQRVKTDSAGVVQTAFAATPTVDTELPTAAALADATANPTVPTVGAAPLTYNGTTWDRARAANSASGTTGTGLAGVGALGFDGTNYQRVKTASAGVVQTAFAATPTVDTELPAAGTLGDAIANPSAPMIGAGRMAYNGTNWERARCASPANGTTGTGVPAAGIMGFDGTNYRRVATDTAGVVSVTPLVSTAGGWSVSSQTALTNTKVAVKASAGTFGGYMIYNQNAAAVYIQVFDVASASVTVGTTTPTYVLSIPGGAAANLEFGMGVSHTAAITVAATTTPTGSTASVSTITATFFYK